MRNFEGKVLFLDRSDINTDEIIPAKYLTEITKEALKPNLFEDLVLDAFDSKTDIAGKNIVISRENFGCGSSREHAPWALEQNGFNVVIAENFARIFRQNMFNCGMLAIELPKQTIDRLFSGYIDSDINLSVNLSKKTITIHSGNQTEEIKFSLASFDEALVNAGGWVDYVDTKY